MVGSMNGNVKVQYGAQFQLRLYFIQDKVDNTLSQIFYFLVYRDMLENFFVPRQEEDQHNWFQLPETKLRFCMRTHFN